VANGSGIGQGSAAEFVHLGCATGSWRHEERVKGRESGVKGNTATSLDPRPQTLDPYRMFALLKLIQSIIKTLHSAGTPGQVAAGIALGSALGLTPLMNLHNLVIFSLLILLNVSFGGGMLGWMLFVPVGFLLDPIFDRIGLSMLTASSLRPLWTDMTNTPVLPYTNFNNTVVLGSFAAWVVLAIPIFFAARYGVARYRATIGERVQQSRFYKAITASQVYNWYKMFRP
jgi:uncharacterized protein (TIGR03546 family)